MNEQKYLKLTLSEPVTPWTTIAIEQPLLVYTVINTKNLNTISANIEFDSKYLFLASNQDCDFNVKINSSVSNINLAWVLIGKAVAKDNVNIKINCKSGNFIQAASFYLKIK